MEQSWTQLISYFKFLNKKLRRTSNTKPETQQAKQNRMVKSYKVNDEGGFEMKFKVDDDGNVSGGNRNDSGPSTKKTYSGTFKDGQFYIYADFESGQRNLYVGTYGDGRIDIQIDVLEGGSGSWHYNLELKEKEKK